MHEPRDAGETSSHERPIGRLALLVVGVLIVEIVVLGLLTRGCA